MLGLTVGAVAAAFAAPFAGAASPLQVGLPYYLQINVPAAGRGRGRTECRVHRGPPPGAVDRIFVETGCTRADSQQLTRWDSGRRRMIPAKDISARAPFVSPAALLDLHAWAPARAFADRPGRPATGDYKVVLKSLEAPSDRDRGPWRSKILLRSGAWSRTEEVIRKGSTSLVVENVEIPVVLFTRRAPENGVVLTIRGPSPIFPSPPRRDYPRIAKEPDLTVLGERCRWWDLMPGVQDAGLWECRAADGVPLAQRHFGRGYWDEVYAVEVRRERVPLTSVLPTNAEVSGKALGLAN